MNRFIVIVEEDYDQYTVDVTYPLETELSREDLQEILREYGQNVVAKWKDKTSFTTCPPLRLVGMRRPIDDVSFLGSGFPNYNVKIPLVLTIDEWFAQEKEKK